MPTYKVYCSWVMCGEREIEADSAASAEQQAWDGGLPDNGAYLSDSFAVESIEEATTETTAKDNPCPQ